MLCTSQSSSRGGIKQLSFSEAPDPQFPGRMALMVDVDPVKYITKLGYRSGRVRWGVVVPTQVQLPLIWTRQNTVSISRTRLLHTNVGLHTG